MISPFQRPFQPVYEQGSTDSKSLSPAAGPLHGGQAQLQFGTPLQQLKTPERFSRGEAAKRSRHSVGGIGRRVRKVHFGDGDWSQSYHSRPGHVPGFSNVMVFFAK